MVATNRLLQERDGTIATIHLYHRSESTEDGSCGSAVVPQCFPHFPLPRSSYANMEKQRAPSSTAVESVLVVNARP